MVRRKDIVYFSNNLTQNYFFDFDKTNRHIPNRKPKDFFLVSNNSNSIGYMVICNKENPIMVINSEIYKNFAIDFS